MKGGDQAAEDEKKRSGNAAVADLPRHPLPLHRRHLRHLHPRRPLPHQARHTHPAAVGVAPAVATAVNPESNLRRGKRRNNPKKKGKKEKRHKRKKDKKSKGGEENSGPVQISKYLKERKKGKYSMISGKKIKMKVKKSKKDKQRDKNRAELLEFLNSTL